MKPSIKTAFSFILLILIISLGGAYAGRNSIALSHLNIMESFESYKNCVDQFYPKWWCLKVPL